MSDDGDFAFSDASWVSYGTGAVDLVVYVEDNDDLAVALRRQRAWIRERLTNLILVGDALPPHDDLVALVRPVDADVAARIAGRTVIVTRRTTREQAAIVASEQKERERHELLLRQARARAPAPTHSIVVTTDGRVDVRDDAEDREADERGARLGDGPDRDVIVAAASRGPNHRPPHADAASLVAPPVHARELRGGPASEAAPRGLMAPFLGVAVDRGALSDGEDMLDPRDAARVRAWILPSLIGRFLVVHDVTRVASALRGLLFDAFGDIPFRVDSGGGYGGFPKTLHLHTSVVAPPEGDEAMAIEIYGRIVSIGDPTQPLREMGRALLHLDTSSPRDDLGTRAGRRAAAIEAIGGRFPVPICVRIDAATYANVMFPGVDVPFYM